MYRRVALLFFVLSLSPLAFPTLTAASVDCSPYEVYSVGSVFQIDGWLLINALHWSYTCEMIAGEWVNRVDTANSYLILTDGRRAFLIGGSGPPLDWTMPAGFLDGTFYAVRISTYKEQYKNIAVTINGEPRNITFTRNVRVEEIYRFNGTCFEPVSKCSFISYPNGTSLKTCNGTLVNVSPFKLPRWNVHGSPVMVEGRNLTFSLDGNQQIARLPEGMNPSLFALTAFGAKNGVVLINKRVLRLPAGTTIRDAPILFGIENETIVEIRIQQDFNEMVCNYNLSETEDIVGQVDTKAFPVRGTTTSRENGICGPGLLVLLSVAGPALKKLQRRW
ncbi:hypothetical protein [Thermococcus sp. JdF3]|uniref:hypothetical protein n=1 Tax=Thermococcus sp. JdF3 TaxID=1638258 RepID=UPI00143BB2C6|nr:hypothetical protein [Thermococcus sp. JdF3]NJE01794.1 hypothetical protein [Thermococcus sp. JdF3]